MLVISDKPLWSGDLGCPRNTSASFVDFGMYWVTLFCGQLRSAAPRFRSPIYIRHDVTAPTFDIRRGEVQTWFLRVKCWSLEVIFVPGRIQVCSIVSTNSTFWPILFNMGYSSNEKKSIVDFCESKTESLSNWVRQVKSKSLNAKTKRKRDLRIIAILSNSLSRAESELISKQRERARRWAQMQADLGLCNKEEEVAKQQQKKIDNFWKNDLSGLDSFFRELDNVKPAIK